MLIKKLGALLLTLSLAAACIPGTLAAAEGSEWFDLEVENGTGVSGAFIQTNSATGRKYYTVNTSNKSAKTSTMSFELDAQGTYDIWAVIGVENWDYIGGYSFTLDEYEFYKKSMEKAYLDAEGDVLYDNAGALIDGVGNAPMRWVKIDSSKTIGSGSHNLIATTADCTASEGRALGHFDVVRFVPSSWNWTPDSSFDAPEKPDSTYYEKKAVDGVRENTSRYTTNTATGRQYIMSDDGYGANGSKMTFENVLADNYDVWAVLGVNKTVDAWGSYCVNIDDANEDCYNKGMELMGSDLYGEKLYTTHALYYGNAPVDMYWVKVASNVPLSDGSHSVNVKIGKATSGNHILGAIDCVRIVPTNWNWEGADDFSAPKKVVPILSECYEKKASEGTYNKNAFVGAGDFKHLVANAQNKPNWSQTTYDIKCGGKYDVWAILGVNASANYIGSYVVSLNGKEVYNKDMSQMSGDLYGDSFGNSGNLSGSVSVPMCWVKLASVAELPKGENTVKISIENNIADLGNGTHNNLGAINRVRIVPSSWGWEPTGASYDAPVAPEVVYDSFTLTGDKAANGTMTATATNIGKTVDGDRNAVVIIAVYKDNKLVDVAPSTVTALTSEGQPITATVTLPSDVTGVTVRAFLWDGLTAGMPYANFIEK